MVGRYFLQPHVVLGGTYVRPPHNRLVTESAVSNSRVPPQMMPSQLLPLVSLIPHYGRNDSQPWTCGKCGTCHRENHWCPAANRKCYHCRRYGHYAQFCATKKTERPGSQHQAPMTPRETIQASQVSVSAVAEPDVITIQRLTSQLSDLEQKLLKADNENDLLGANCKDLRVKNQQLADQVHQLEKELLPLRITCTDFKVHNEDLAEQLSRAEQSLGEATQKATLQDGQLRKLLQFSVTLDGCCTEFEHLTEHLIQEYYELQEHYEPPENNRRLCNRCGTGSHPTGAACPANGWYCCRCGKTNHFAAMCLSEKLPRPDTDEQTILLIRTLEQTTGITFGKTVNCVKCDNDDDDDDDE